MNIRILISVVALSILPLVSKSASAQTIALPSDTRTTPSPGSRLEITLSMSRSQAVAGGGLGVTGTLSNVGRDSTIYLSQQNIALTVPPELNPGTSTNSSLFAYFPTELAGKADSVVIALRPGSRYRVSWLIVQKDSTLWTRVKNEFRYLFFSPGNYEVVVNGKYWTTPARGPFEYQTYTQSAVLSLASPQSVILLGAMVGGLLAYLLFPNRRSRELVVSRVSEGDAAREVRLRKTIDIGKRLWGMLGAMVWSAIVTILLSRLAESQFVIRVSIADFWGAIAIGFVAQYAGSKWLERLLPNSPDPPSTPAPASATTIQTEAVTGKT
ncbi:MAG TPA: hypothetical protein VGC13_16605 [Longimicrobium sp.]|jgi:hypothetical protein|uniref:hypothetical protein n=1 Tax=Longimicrobium sp. TaxID=2029185 RepID=UPI002EDAACDC